jgi:hypothetical protein
MRYTANVSVSSFDRDSGIVIAILTPDFASLLRILNECHIEIFLQVHTDFIELF